MAREVLSNGVINPDKYQADWYADLSNNWHLLNNLIGSAISSSEVDSKIATAIQELMIRTFQIVAELPATGTEGVMYLVLIPNTSKYTAYVWENNAYRELGVIQMTITIDDELSTTSENPVQNKVITNALGGKANSSHTHSASDITSGLASVATSGSYNDLSNTPTIPTVNNATLTIQQNGVNVQTFTANASTNATANITVPTKTSDLTNDSGFITSDNTKIPLAGSNQISGSLIPATTDAYDLGSSSYQWNNAYIKSLTINGVACGDILTHNESEFVPRSGGAVMTGSRISRNVDNSEFSIDGGSGWEHGSTIALFGKDTGGYVFIAANTGVSGQYNFMYIYPNGTWTWSGTACQTTSDQRLKQQIAEIDDKLLDAWEDVELSQFKYNDAVDQKGNNARLHTGYVVQQIDEACKKHNVDISEYGLYCHEEYPEETEEVEVEQADGTKTKERKVIREANEHYSLRYTEALIVECAYLRKKNKDLQEQLNALSERLEKLENR